jgi:hypothetical protein
MRTIDPKVEVASGEFDRRKTNGIRPSIRAVAQLFDITPNKLANYRANYLSRKSRDELKRINF